MLSALTDNVVGLASPRFTVIQTLTIPCPPVDGYAL
jgi:hypothetical protein